MNTSDTHEHRTATAIKVDQREEPRTKRSGILEIVTLGFGSESLFWHHARRFKVGPVQRFLAVKTSRSAARITAHESANG